MTVTSPNLAEDQTVTEALKATPAAGAESAQTQQVTKLHPAKPTTKPIAKKVAKPVATAVAKPVVNAVAAKKTVTASKSTIVKTSPVPLNKPAAKPIATKTQKATSEKTAKAEKAAKAKKPKMVRDSFTMPKEEISVIDDLKLRALKLSHAVKKSELIRAGIKALAAMSDSALMAAMKAVPAIKTGRPSK